MWPSFWEYPHHSQTAGQPARLRLLRRRVPCGRLLCAAFRGYYWWGPIGAGADVTASGAGRLCDEESFVGSAALGFIMVPSGAGKMEFRLN